MMDTYWDTQMSDNIASTELAWRDKTDKRLAHIENRLNHMDTRDAVAEVHRVNVEKRLSSIENTLTWLVRLMIGAIIGAFLTFALNGGLVL